MAKACDSCEEPLPLGFSLHQRTTETIETFLNEIEDDFKYLEEILQEVKTHFGRRESIGLLPKTPCMKRKRKVTRRNAQQNDKSSDLSSTEDEHGQESKKKSKIEELNSLQAIGENEVLDTSSVVEETGKKRRSKATRKVRSQLTQPKRCTRSSSRKQVEAGAVLENTYPEKVGSEPRRVTRSRQRKISAKVSIAISESPAVTTVSEAAVSSTAASTDAEGHSLICESTDKRHPKEKITTEIISDPGKITTSIAASADAGGHSLICESPDKNNPKEQSTTEMISGPGKIVTEPKSHDKSSEVQVEDSKKAQQKSSAEDKQRVIKMKATFVPETPEPSQFIPSQSRDKCVGRIASTTDEEESQAQTNDEDIAISEEDVSSAKDTANRGRENVGAESSNSTVKTRQLAGGSKKQAVSTTTEELGHPEEVKQDNDGDDTGDSKSPSDDTAVFSPTVELPKEALQESNECNDRRCTRSSRITCKASLTRKKSTRKTPTLVKSSVTLTLIQTPLVSASKHHAFEKPNSSNSPAGSSDAEQCSTLSNLKQDLFGALQDASDSDNKDDTGNASSLSAGSMGEQGAQSADEQQPTTGRPGSDLESSDDADGQGYAASQEEDDNDDEEDEEEEEIFHDAEEELQEAAAVESKGVDVFTPPLTSSSPRHHHLTPGASEESGKSSEELESDEAKEFKTPERKVVFAGPDKEGKPSNLMAVHSFIKPRYTPRKVNPEDKKSKLQLAMKEKEEKEKDRIEQLEILKHKEVEERRRKREERERRVADLRAAKAKMEEDRKRKMQEKLEQKKCADEKAKKRREKEEDEKRKLRKQKKAKCDARRKQDEEIRQQKLFDQEEEAKRHRELAQRKQEFEEQERQRKIAEMKRHHEFREQELERERELEKLRKLKEIEEKEKEKKVREKEEREREEKAKKAREEKENLERERKAKEEERLKLEKERVRLAKLIREKEEQQENERKLREAREDARQRQEEIRRQEIAEKQRKAAEKTRKAVAMVDTYEMTPPPPPKPRKLASKENYDIDDVRSDDSTDEEDDPKKIIPQWAQGNALWAALLNQQMSAIDVDAIFGNVFPPDLADIFKHKRKRFYQRTSSACWDSPPLKFQAHVTRV